VTTAAQRAAQAAIAEVKDVAEPAKTTEPVSTAPKNVTEAWAAVLAALPAIGKDNRMQGQGGYSYRGIEQITAAAAGLFADYGVFVLPNVKSHERETWTAKNGTLWSACTLVVEWKIFGPGGNADMITATTVGIGYDNSDKGYNKAMSQSFKYLLLPGLMVADSKDEGEHERPNIEPESDHPEPTEAELAAMAQADENARLYKDLMGRATMLKEKDEKYVEALRSIASAAGFGTVNDWGKAHLNDFRAEVEKLEVIAIQDGAEQES
jgi:ERF superfamily